MSLESGIMSKRAAVATLAAAGCAVLLYRRWPLCFAALWRWRRNRIVYSTKPHIVVVESSSQWKAVQDTLTRNARAVGCMGFDTEWVTRDRTRQKIALLQLAVTSGLCVLIRLFKMEEPLPETLLDLLADRKVLKVGVGSKADAKCLFKDYQIVVNGVLDLKDFFISVGGLTAIQEAPKSTTVDVRSDGNKNKSLAETNTSQLLSDSVEACELASNSAIYSNSSSRDVSPCLETENDEEASALLFKQDRMCKDFFSSRNMPEQLNAVQDEENIFAQHEELMKGRNQTVPRMLVLGVDGPPTSSLSALTSYYLKRKLDKGRATTTSDWEAPVLVNRQKLYAAEDAISGLHLLLVLLDKLVVLQSNSLFSSLLCWEAVTRDMLFSISQNFVWNESLASWRPSRNLSSGGSNKTAKGYRKAYSLRKSPLYHNSVLWAPDNEPLCTVDPKKAFWYVDHDLGEVVQEDPLIVRLTFEPTGRPQKEGTDGSFYLQERANRCVVCGKEDSYIRKNVVPHEYRKHFPDILKSHQNHDVVLLCTDCHQMSNQRDSVLRYQLAELHNAPIGNTTDVKVVVDGTLKVIKSAGKALIKRKHCIPPGRIEELRNILKSYFQVTELTDELVRKAAELDVAVVNESYVPHGLKVYQYYEKIGVLYFERLWRDNFLKTMQPEYMPTGWSINHNHEKLKLKMSRHPLDDPIREQYKIAIVGTTGKIDVPYIPQQHRPRDVLQGKKPKRSNLQEDVTSATEEENEWLNKYLYFKS